MRDPGYEPDPLPEEPDTYMLLQSILEQLQELNITVGSIWRAKCFEQAPAPKLPDLPQPGDPGYDDVPF